MNRKDILIFVGIFFLAALIRFPFLGHPTETIFDEHFHHVTISNIHHGLPFFDVHPPLFPLLLESIVRQKNFVPISHGDRKIRVPFGDFPYYNLRFFIAIVGSLLPAIIFLISRLLSIETHLAALPALFIVFDSAFIIYSRAILPDTILLFFGFFGIFVWLLSKKVKNKNKGLLLSCLAAIFFGAAISIKWTGLGFLSTIILYEIFHKRIKKVVLCLVCAIAVYLIFFAVFFTHLAGNHIESAYKADIINSIQFSTEKNITNFSRFFIQYHLAMLRANHTYDAYWEGHKHPAASKPYEWPFGQKIMGFWVNQNNTVGITLSGNLPAWIIGVLAAISLMALVALQMLGYSLPIVIAPATYILLAGFLINYIPLFFISRSLFIYHYFSALIFSYLLIPTALNFWITMLPPSIQSKRLMRICIITLVVWYIAFIPKIYGIPYPI